MKTISKIYNDEIHAKDPVITDVINELTKLIAEELQDIAWERYKEAKGIEN